MFAIVETDKKYVLRYLACDIKS